MSQQLTVTSPESSALEKALTAKAPLELLRLGDGNDNPVIAEETTDWCEGRQLSILKIGLPLAVAVGYTTARFIHPSVGVITMAAILLTAIIAGFQALSLQSCYARADRSHGWRPRAGACHPRGREDTHPRLVREEQAIAGQLVIGLARWIYHSESDRGWQPKSWTIKPHAFAPDDADAIADFRVRCDKKIAAHERRAANRQQQERQLRESQQEAQRLAQCIAQRQPVA